MNDSLLMSPPWAKVSTLEQAPAVNTATCAEVREPWTYGLEPEERQMVPSQNSAVVSVLLILLVVVAIGLRDRGELFSNFLSDAFRARRRLDSLFVDHTISETRTLSASILLTVLCEGILAGCAMGVAASFGGLMAVTGVAAAYYLLQIGAYWTLGYTFTDRASRRQFMRGFVATQSLLGVALLFAALPALFYPSVVGEAVTGGLILYIIARIVFIVKGFRLFYRNFLSLGYFILYLCTLEIAPVLALLRMAVQAA